jgi:hypothetical protein
MAVGSHNRDEEHCSSARSRGGASCLETPLDGQTGPAEQQQGRPCGGDLRTHAALCIQDERRRRWSRPARTVPRGEQSHLMCSQFAPAGTALHRACCRRRSSSRHAWARTGLS